MEMQETLKYHDEKKCFNTKNVDIRAKMFILIIANLSLIFSQNLFEEFILEISILIFGILLKQYRFILKILNEYIFLVSNSTTNAVLRGKIFKWNVKCFYCYICCIYKEIISLCNAWRSHHRNYKSK